MNTFYDDKEFEDFLRSSADNFKLIPNPSVWRSIYNHFHPGSKLPSSITALVLVGLISLAGFLHTSNSFTTKDSNGYAATIASDGAALNKLDVQPTLGALPKRVGTENSNSITDGEALATTSKENNGTTFPLIVKNSNTIAFEISDVRNEKTNTSVDSRLTARKRTSSRKAETAASTSSVKVTSPASEDLVFRNEDDSKRETAINSIAIEKENAAKNNKVTTSTNAVSETVTDETAEAELENELNKTEAVNSDSSKKVEAVDNKVIKTNNDVSSATNNLNQNVAELPKLNRAKLSIEYYVTPSIGYRNLVLDNTVSAARSSFLPLTNNTSGVVQHAQAFNAEIGFAYGYQVSSRVKLKAGAQLNIASYKVKGTEVAHPFSTVVPSAINAIPQISLASMANTIDGTEWSSSSSYQVSLPVGIYFEALRQKKWSVYAGGTIQPTYVFGGNIKLLSSDKQYYTNELQFLRRLNLNVGAEAYLQYNFKDLSIMAGPQFRYQVLSTYQSSIAHKENLYNLGFKIGVAKRL